MYFQQDSLIRRLTAFIFKDIRASFRSLQEPSFVFTDLSASFVGIKQFFVLRLPRPPAQPQETIVAYAFPLVKSHSSPEGRDVGADLPKPDEVATGGVAYL